MGSQRQENTPLSAYVARHRCLRLYHLKRSDNPSWKMCSFNVPLNEILPTNGVPSNGQSDSCSGISLVWKYLRT